LETPYDGLSVSQWRERTLELIRNHPLDTNELYNVVLKVWNDIFTSELGSKPFKIGVDIFPRPQIMAFLLHELIPLELSHRYQGIWRREDSPDEKDLVYIPDPLHSIEIKCSSSAKNIYGNRSYVQEGQKTRKSKSGYYLAVNFQKFSKTVRKPGIMLVRFGWLDYTDWIGQVAETGQQARLSSEAERFKLISLPVEIQNSP
jgi:hypothetical protein